MKAFKTLIGKLAPVSLLMAAMLSPMAQAQELSLADSFPLDHYLSKQGTVWWMNKVTELTDGKLTFKHYPAEQIAKAHEILRRVQDHVVDVGYVGIGYVSDRMPLNGAPMLPGVVQDSVAASEAYWSELKDPNSVYRKEFEKNGVVPVFAVMLPPYQVVLNKPALKSVADFKGLNLRASGSLDLAVQAMGASAVSMAAPDIYLALQRGTLDGSLLPITSITPYRIDEVAKSISTNGAFGSFGITVAMNKSSYDQLSAAEKSALMKAGDETVKHLAEFQSSEVNTLLTQFKKQGIDVYSFDDTTLTAINKHLDDVRAEWVSRMKKRGLDGQEALDELDQALRQQGK